jgi:hypothetical protein
MIKKELVAKKAAIKLQAMSFSEEQQHIFNELMMICIEKVLKQNVTFTEMNQILHYLVDTSDLVLLENKH